MVYLNENDLKVAFELKESLRRKHLIYCLITSQVYSTNL